MLALRLERDAVPGLVSISIEPDGLALVHVVSTDGAPRLECCEFLSAAPLDRRSVLTDAVERFGLRGARSVFVLAPEEYAFHVIDAPDVKENELAQAARWAVRDLMDFDVEEAIVDVCDAVSHRRRPDARRLSVVAAREQAVRDAFDLARSAGLRVEAVEATEFAIRDLLTLHLSEEEGVAALAIRDDLGLIAISRRSELAFSRWINARTEELAMLDAKDAEWIDEAEHSGREVLEDVFLQLKRSLDYSEHEIGLRPRGGVVLFPTAVELPALEPYLERMLDLPIAPFDVCDLFECDNPVGIETQARCLAALGGGLREHVASEQTVDFAGPLRRALYVPLSPRLMAQVAVGLAGLLVFASVVILSMNTFRGRGIGTLEAEVAASSAQVAELEEQLNEHMDTSAIETESNRLTRELQSKRELLSWITDPRLSNREGFAEQLRGLSRQDVEGVWLSKFALEHGGASVSLTGNALGAELVPRFLQRLADESEYKGREFDTFVLSRSEENPSVIEFRVGRDAAEGQP